MQILVIPDIHMKTWMLDQADKIIKREQPDAVVQLGDLPDDWNQEDNQDGYKKFYDRAELFVKEHPDIYWCYGNHDVCYEWDFRETGMAIGDTKDYITTRIKEFYGNLPDEKKGFIHYIDGIMFSHAGVLNSYLEETWVQELMVEDMIHQVNMLTPDDLWLENSPIWARPQGQNRPMLLYKDLDILQVVGHTPMERITQEDNLISCDVFSTYPNGEPIGTNEFLLIDSGTRQWRGVK